MTQTVKNPLAMQETQEMWVPSLSQEDPLEEGMETHSGILLRECHGQGSLGAAGRKVRVGPSRSDSACVHRT